MGAEVWRLSRHSGKPPGSACVSLLRTDGIANLELAMKDGYTTGGGLGLGLGGAKQLSNEFEIDSHPGQGTRVTITRWKG